jgi:hypothetical protein
MVTWLIIAGGLLLAGGLTAASWQSNTAPSLAEGTPSTAPPASEPPHVAAKPADDVAPVSMDLWHQDQPEAAMPFPPTTEGLPIAAIPEQGSPGLIISEYIEGPFHNKALEFCNASDADIDTGDYELRIRGFSGAGHPFTVDIPLVSKRLRSGETFVLMIEHVQADFPGLTPDQRHARLAFNGDDTLILWNRTTDRAEDVFGVEGQDPGDFWIHEGVATEGQTLARHGSVRSGSRNGFVPLDRLSREWIASEEGTHSLGQHELATD